MPRALEGLDATLQRFEQGDSSTLEGLGEEFTPRETRRIKMALQTARRGTIKTLARYDFSFQPSLERDRIMARAQLEWIARRQTGHFMGPPGSSGRRAGRRGRAGKSVHFGSLAQLVASMTQAEPEGRLLQRLRDLARHSLLIVDEIGSLPIGSNGGNPSNSSTPATSAATASSLLTAAWAKGGRLGRQRSRRSIARSPVTPCHRGAH